MTAGGEHTDWTELNRAMWDERVAPHAASRDYGLDRYVSDPAHLSGVVRFDQPRLGDVRGLRGVHLQCHLGTDTLSLHRLGARMSGLDFSAPAVAAARDLAARAGAEIDYAEGDLYSAPDLLGRGAFDLVYTGIGALCWLPDVAAWGRVVADLLRPGGRLFLREGHPVLWALDDTREDDLLVLEHSYSERDEPEVFDEPGTYVDTDHEFVHTAAAEWNHGLGQVVTAVLDAGLQLTALVEHDSVPWQALPRAMEALPDGEFRLSDRPWRLPHTYTLQALKR